MKEEQIDRLLKIIEENGYSTVKYIAKAVYASESTVRRQLAELERNDLKNQEEDNDRQQRHCHFP